MNNSNTVHSSVNTDAVTKASIERSTATPSMAAVDFTAVPAALQSLPGWIAWYWHRGPERWTKVPLFWALSCRTDADGTRRAREKLRRASSTAAKTWDTFEAVTARLVVHDEISTRRGGDLELGLGLVLSEPFGVTVIDLDDCRDPVTGTVIDEAAAIVRLLDSYTEVSPSGTGLKIYVLAAKPGPRCKNLKRGVELYDRVRFVAVTGRHLAGTPTDIEPRQAAVDALYADLFPPDPHAEETEAAARTTVNGAGRPALASDAELVDHAIAARNGHKFAALWHGDTGAYGDDESAADFALACKLAFWCGPDPARVLSLMWQSGLVRGKWRSRPKYLTETVARAVGKLTHWYGDGHGYEDPEFAHLRGMNLTFVPPKRKGPRRDGCPCPAAPGAPAAHTHAGDGAALDPFAGLDTDAARRVAREAREEAEAAAAVRRAIDKHQCDRHRQFACPRSGRTVMKHKTKREAVIIYTRCDRWDCPGCGALHKEKHRDNFTLRLVTTRKTPAPLYAATVPAKRWRTFAKRIERAGGDYIRFGPGNGESFWVVATVDVFDDLPAEGRLRLPAAEAADRLRGYVVSYFGDRSPVSASKAWQLPKRDTPVVDQYERVGKVDSFLKDEHLARIIRAAQAEGEERGATDPTARIQRRIVVRFTYATTEAMEERFYSRLMWGDLPPPDDVPGEWDRVDDGGGDDEARVRDGTLDLMNV